MGGGLMLPTRMPRDAIRRHGRTLRLDGEELIDFVEIIAGIDDFYVETESRRIAADAERAAKASKKAR